MIEETNFLHFEDFPPVDKRPECPLCGKDMIHAQVMRSDGNNLHVWICDCEPQGENVEKTIREIRKSGDKTEAMVIGPDSASDAAKPIFASALKVAMDALDYIAALEDKTSVQIAKLTREKVDKLLRGDFSY